MFGGILMLTIFMIYPIIVFILMKKYLEEKNKSDIALFNKSIVEFEEQLKIKYLLRPLRSLQLGLLSLFIGIGTSIGAFFRYDKMTYIISNLGSSQDFYTKSQIRDENIYLMTALTISCILILMGLSLIIYYYVSINKLRKV
jgi:hypothetical protein